MAIRRAAGKVKAAMEAGLLKRAWWLRQTHRMALAAAPPPAAAAGAAGPRLAAAEQDVAELLAQCIAGAFPFSAGPAFQGGLPQQMLDSFRDLESELHRAAEELQKLPCERLRAQAFWANRLKKLEAAAASKAARRDVLVGELASGDAAGRVRASRWDASAADRGSVSTSSAEFRLLRGQAYLLGRLVSAAKAQVAAGGGGAAAGGVVPGAAAEVAGGAPGPQAGSVAGYEEEWEGDSYSEAEEPAAAAM